MRKTILLLAATFSAACADQSPSAPAGKAPNASAVANLGPAVGNAAQSKPTDQVGFTKITRFFGTTIAVGANAFGAASATCPAGSTVVGGGYSFANYGSSRPFAYQSHDDNANGWIVDVDNTGQPYSTYVVVVAYCAT